LKWVLSIYALIADIIGSNQDQGGFGHIVGIGASGFPNKNPKTQNRRECGLAGFGKSGR
jgi:hypothetical protein